MGMNSSTSRSVVEKTRSLNERTLFPLSFYFPKLSLYILAICLPLLIILLILQIQFVHPPSKFSSSSSSWSASLLEQWQTVFGNKPNCKQDTESMTRKLRDSVTFLPLKDLRFADQPLPGHTWFLSSMNDTHEQGDFQYQQFPSESSKGRLLCLKGRDAHDGSRNYYALAWPEALPSDTILMKGLTFVSYNHYDYENIWHGLSALVPFVAWHRKNSCEAPTRWILYHWGELRFKIATWLDILIEATFGQVPYIERFNEIEDDDQLLLCFEKAVVMRHNEGGMSREKIGNVYDLISCKARMYCNVSLERNTSDVIGMTLLLRTGPRSFKNDTAVTGIFEKECKKVDGCRLMVAYSNNLTVCEQVKLMSLTDILITPHGAQLTNMFLMDRNSSVLEFFPTGWLKFAGVGQYVFQWMASWAGMKHRGIWRDPDGVNCPYPEDDHRCMSIYKSGRIGYNETHFAEWARDVLNDVKTRKLEEASKNGPSISKTCDCG